MISNNLDAIMNDEALSNSVLSRFAGLSDKTVSKLRKNESTGTITTQNKITVGLNKNPNKVKRGSYAKDEIFPNSKK